MVDFNDTRRRLSFKAFLSLPQRSGVRLWKSYDDSAEFAGNCVPPAQRNRLQHGASKRMLLLRRSVHERKAVLRQAPQSEEVEVPLQALCSSRKPGTVVPG